MPPKEHRLPVWTSPLPDIRQGRLLSTLLPTVAGYSQIGYPSKGPPAYRTGPPPGNEPDVVCERNGKSCEGPERRDKRSNRRGPQDPFPGKAPRPSTAL